MGVQLALGRFPVDTDAANMSGNNHVEDLIPIGSLFSSAITDMIPVRQTPVPVLVMVILSVVMTLAHRQ